MSEKTAPKLPISLPYCVNIFSADDTGCDWYRNQMPMNTIMHGVGDITFNNCRKFMTDINFFRGVNLNVLQRQVSDAQCEYYLKFIIPMSKQCGSWIVYNVDDCLHKDDIPKYNKAWETYQNDGYMDNIKRMVQASDFLLVTTDELGEYYRDKFGASEDSLIVIPNYIPYWWMGQCWNFERKMREYEEFVVKRGRPRIGIIGAPSHYDINGKKIKNDITALLPYISKTIKDYQWVIFGSIIPELFDYVRSGEIEYHQGVDILHYPKRLSDLRLQYVVAPLVDNTFNRCKSSIKLTECWASGIGCAAQDLPCYSKYTEDVFSDNDALDAILKRDLASSEVYAKKISENFRKMDDWWLESHLHDWSELYHLRQKPLIYNYDYAMSKERAGNARQPKLRDDEVVMPAIKKEIA